MDSIYREGRGLIAEPWGTAHKDVYSAEIFFVTIYSKGARC